MIIPGAERLLSIDIQEAPLRYAWQKLKRNRTLEKHILNISQFVWQESEGPFRFVFSERDIMAPFHFICLD